MIEVRAAVGVGVHLVGGDQERTRVHVHSPRHSSNLSSLRARARSSSESSAVAHDPFLTGLGTLPPSRGGQVSPSSNGLVPDGPETGPWLVCRGFAAWSPWSLALAPGPPEKWSPPWSRF